LGGCETEPIDAWLDQGGPAGPCFEVDLGDGLSEDSTDELGTLYDCLNQGGNLDPLGGVIDALDAETRAGAPVGVEIAILLNDLIASGVGLAGELLDLAREIEPEDIDQATGAAADVAALSVELIYGQPWPVIAGGGVELNAAASLEAGLLVPLLPVAGEVASALLDADPSPLAGLPDALAERRAISLLHTAAALVEVPESAARMEALPARLGDAIDRSRDAGNDVWSGASGDSLRDTVDALLLNSSADGRSALAHLADPAHVLLEDPVSLARTRQSLERLSDAGALESLPEQVMHLVEVDASGADALPGGEGTLVALLRLLDRADADLTCSFEIDLWEAVDWDNLELTLLTVPDLAAEILRVIARMDPDVAVGGVDLLGQLLTLEVLGFDLTALVLDEIVAGGYCDLLDAQMVADLHAIDRFNDDAAPDLLRYLLEFLSAFYDADGSHDRTGELVDLLGEVHRQGLTPPLEELLRDLGYSELAAELVWLVPVLLDPDDALGAYDGLPEGVGFFDFEDAWNAALGAITPGDDGQTAPERWGALLQVTLRDDSVWESLSTLSALLQASDARLGGAGPAISAMADTDPSLEATREALEALLEPETLDPLLRIGETERLRDAIGHTELTAEGPLPFWARLVTGGTLDDLLRTVGTLLGLLELD